MPGLAEMHGHIPPPNAPKEYTEAVLFLYVANGITTVRGMLGAPNQLELRDKANRGELVSPTLYLAGPSFNGNSVNSPEQAVSMARQQKQEGWDLLKVHPGLTRDEYDAMAKTAKEVGIRFAGHVPADVRIIHALEMGQETIDHSVPGFSIHREMAHMVKCGFTPYQIIHSGTKNVGDYFKSKDNFGTIEAGKRADLILVEANPLKDVANVAKRAGVMLRGQWLPESEIRKRLDGIAASWKAQ